MATLSARDERIFDEYAREGMTLKELARRNDLTQERCRQILRSVEKQVVAGTIARLWAAQVKGEPFVLTIYEPIGRDRPNDSIHYLHYMLKHFETQDLDVILRFEQLGDGPEVVIYATDNNFVPTEGEK